MDQPSRTPESKQKCCPAHLSATNRQARREANKWCQCRGECGWHLNKGRK